ncbi:MAG: hypothetical protein FJ292_03785 [Planctomycetes bacterium]|nr:hypothetical protein [Planctomycetota bacterium]
MPDMLARRLLSIVCLSVIGILDPASLAGGQVVGWWPGQERGLLTSGNSSPLGFRRIAGGSEHSVALRADGTVACWGSNETGETVAPTGLGGVRKVVARSLYSGALKSDGTVICWGAPYNGALEPPAGLASAVDLAAGGGFFIAALADGSVRCWGANWDGQTSIPQGLDGVVRVGAGLDFSLACRSDGAVRAWGRNSNGQCDVPSDLGDAVAVAGGLSHAVALRAGGAIRCWGCRGASQAPVTVPDGLGTVVEIAAGTNHTVALSSQGTVRCWGTDDGRGSCGVPSGLSGVVSIGAGEAHSIAVRSDGSVVSWGWNNSGQCNPPRSSFGVVGVTSSGIRVTLVKDDGTVTVWGDGGSDVPAGIFGVTSADTGDYHSIALKSDGSVACWGDNGAGACDVPAGLSPSKRVAAGGYHSLALSMQGRAACWGLDAYGQCTPPQQMPTLVEIGAGKLHSLAVRSDGLVEAWGAGSVNGGSWPDYGQSAVPSGLHSVMQVDAGDFHSVALRIDGTVVCWGSNAAGQCAVPEDLPPAVQVAAGNVFTLALRADGSVRGWLESMARVPTGLDHVRSIAAGNNAFALLDESLSSCIGGDGAGSASLAVSGGLWQDVGIWNWTGGGRRVPGAASVVDFGSYASVGSACDAAAAALTTRSATTLLVPTTASVPGNDHSIRVTGKAQLAGRLWLLGVHGAASALPEDLDLPVLSAGEVEGTFDLIQTEVPPPPGFFVTLVPEDVDGRTVLSLRLLALPGGGELTASSTGTFSGKAVAAETIDINHDGFDDLALAVDFGAGQNGLIQILLNDGAGGLGSASVLTSIPLQPTCLAVGDVDGDGDRDVAVGISSDSTARVYLDNGTGSLMASTVYSGLGGTPLSIAIVEPAGSSVMAATGFVAVGTSNSKLRIYSETVLQQEIVLAGTPNTLKPGKTDVIRPTGINSGGTRTASIDGLLPVAETGFVQTLMRAPSGLFELKQTMYLTAKPVAMDVADLDGDGLDDIVTTNIDPALPDTGSALPVLSIFRNSGGTFGGGMPYQPATASSGLDVSLIDVDNDGDRDIVSVYKRVGTDSEAALLRVDTLGPGTPISIGQTTVLDASDPILSARGNLDGSGGEDLLLVNQPAGAFFVGTQEVKPFLATGGLKQGDLDGDGTVGASDISILLLDFGPCPGCPSDLDGSGEVDAGDLSFLLLLFE